MSEWHVTRLSEVCEIVGRGITPQYVDDGPVIVVNQKCIREGRLDLAASRRHGGRAVTASKLIQEGDVLVNSTGVGTLGRTAAVQELEGPTTVDTHVTIARPSTGDPGWVRYLFRLLEPSIEALAEGSTGQTELSRHRLAELEVLLPSLAEQRAIAGVLGALDDKIDSNRRVARTIRELLAADFRQRFGEMSPRTTLRQLVARVNKAVQTGPFGSNLHASDYGDAGVPLVLVKHVLNGEIADVGLPLVVAEKASELTSYRLSKDDIVITRVGRVGDAALVRGTQEGWLFSGQMLRVNLAEVPQIDPFWLVQWYQTSEFRDLISAFSVGSTRESLSTSILADAPMPLVEHSAQASFRDVAEPLHKRWAAAARESRYLSVLRDALLPELLSGQLRVVDAEKVVEGAV